MPAGDDPASACWYRGGTARDARGTWWASGMLGLARAFSDARARVWTITEIECCVASPDGEEGRHDRPWDRVSTDLFDAEKFSDPKIDGGVVPMVRVSKID